MTGARLLIAASTLAVVSMAGAPLDVPFHKQQKNGCGAASVAMVMHYWTAKAPNPDEVYHQLYDPNREGILLTRMRAYLEEQEFEAFTLRGGWRDIERHLAKGRPTIVGLRTKANKRIHFAVIVGVDGDRIWLNDPTRRTRRRMKQSEFWRMWDFADRWMLIATPRPAPSK